MPAASLRIMPARSISRWLTVSASAGVSRTVESRNRETRMDVVVLVKRKQEWSISQVGGAKKRRLNRKAASLFQVQRFFHDPVEQIFNLFDRGAGGLGTRRRRPAGTDVHRLRILMQGVIHDDIGAEDDIGGIGLHGAARNTGRAELHGAGVAVNRPGGAEVLAGAIEHGADI